MKTTRTLIALAALASVAAGCSTGSDPEADSYVDTGAEETGCETSTCTSHEECDDGIDCTDDTCVIGGCCEHDPDDGACPYGHVCDPVLGCVEYDCVGDAECDDGLDCTDDTCLIDHTCMNQDTCPSGEHCTATGCEPDATACTTDEDCDDGDFCNGDEVCDDEFGCQEAEHPRECVDSDPCTVDACDSSANMCTFTCDPTIPGCEEECPTDYFPGCFNIVPMLSYSCAFGMVGYNFNQICCTVEGLSLNCSASGVGADGTLSEVGYSGGAHFEVTTTVEGGCTEDYSFTGDFTDPDTFSGLWYVHFTQTDGFSCTMGGCTDQTVYVTGTRVP